MGGRFLEPGTRNPEPDFYGNERRNSNFAKTSIDQFFRKPKFFQKPDERFLFGKRKKFKNFAERFFFIGRKFMKTRFEAVLISREICDKPVGTKYGTKFGTKFGTKSSGCEPSGGTLPGFRHVAIFSHQQQRATTGSERPQSRTTAATQPKNRRNNAPCRHPSGDTSPDTPSDTPVRTPAHCRGRRLTPMSAHQHVVEDVGETGSPTIKKILVCDSENVRQVFHEKERQAQKQQRAV